MTLYETTYIGLIAILFLFYGYKTYKNEMKFIKNSVFVDGKIIETTLSDESLILIIEYYYNGVRHILKTGNILFKVRIGEKINIRVFEKDSLHIAETKAYKHFYSLIFYITGIVLGILPILSLFIEMNRNIDEESVYVYLFMVPFIVLFTVMYHIANEKKKEIGR
jgi:hypothetical protein